MPWGFKDPYRVRFNTRDSNFTILVELLTNHVLAKNLYFTNHIDRAELKIMILKPTKK